MTKHLAEQRLTALRAVLRQRGLTAYLVPSTDPHQSEVVPACWQRRAWLSGFSGSAGDLLVTRHAAGLWTDGRYFTQAERELAGSTITLFRQGEEGVPTLTTWLGQHLRQTDRLGIDAALLSWALKEKLVTALHRSGAKLVPLTENLVDAIWRDRPELPDAPVLPHPLRFAGQSVAAKLARVRAVLKEQGSDAHWVSKLDAIAWLYNIRGGDVAYTPVVIAHALVTAREALLFVDEKKICAATRRQLAPQVVVRPYTAAQAVLGELGRRGARVWFDQGSATEWLIAALRPAKPFLAPSPIGRLQAKKNAVELAGMKQAQRRDGVALVRFFHWLYTHLKTNTISECSAADQLAAFRALGQHYRGDSFQTIAAYRDHGAIIHYAPQPGRDATLSAQGLLLLDSGGQYLDGTTDVTRTVLLGDEAPDHVRDAFTRVLKGQLALASTVFPQGTTGQQLDALARAPLWANQLNYRHGTGHGVGSFLGVHEGPISLHPSRSAAPFEEGNVLSIEPGYYQPGEYGIRLENLVYVNRAAPARHAEGRWFEFQPLTMCPFDLRLVKRSLLTPGEKRWLNAYHRRVRQHLEPLLDPPVQRWLAQATRSL